jgi:extracellular factor (EF) 3-hydroxypalmitic acid methyl ester biosynthesis protein
MDVVTGRVAIERLDLAYTAGLYDYLPLPVARRLTARMFAMLRPGGRVLVANFCPELRDAGYMESFMNWPLIYRTEQEMHGIADALPAAEVARRCVFRDPGGDIVYLEVERA